MKKQIFSLALWMFFGFVAVNAADSILRFIIKAYLYFGLWFEFSIDFLSYSIPILGFIIYSLTGILVIKYINHRTINFELSEIEFPKASYFVTALIAILLNPITNKLTGLFAENMVTMNLDYESSEFLKLYGTTEASLGVCGWLTIIFLSIYLYRIYKKNEIETEQ